MTRLVGGAAFVALGVGDLVLRQIARFSPLARAVGADELSPWWPVLLTGAGLAIALGQRSLPRVVKPALVWTVIGAAGIAAQLQMGARLQSDGFYYYAFTRSIWFDHDLDLTNDYAMLGIDDPQHQFLLEPTVTGYAQSAWAIGPAIAWSPFFGIGHLAAHVLAAGGGQLSTDGTSFPYRQAVCLGGLFYGLVGLWASYRLARRIAGARLSTVAVITVGAGTFLLWYLVREPTMSHSVSMASVAVFALAWTHIRESSSWRAWAVLGLIGGVMVIMRWQNAVVLLVPALGLWRHPRYAVAFAAGVWMGTWPQLWTWHALYGEWITQPPVSPRLLWAQAQWIDVLWSSRSGLFATSPAAYLGVIGLLFVWRLDRWIAGLGLTVFLLMTWTNGAVEDWWAGASFGGRRFDSLIPFLVCGCAALAEAGRRAVRARPGVATGVALGLLVIWNVSLMAVARSGAYRIGQIVSFGDLAAAQAAVVHDAVGHAPSWPANLLWAWANGVAPGRFDRLRPNRFLGDPSRPYGRIDVGADDTDYLMSGWHGAEGDAALTFRWATDEVSLIVPLAAPADLWLQVQAAPFDAPGLPPQQMTAIVNGQAMPAVTLAPGWQRVEIATTLSTWHAGINHVTLRFARASRPSDAGGADTRLLSAAVDYVRIQKR